MTTNRKAAFFQKTAVIFLLCIVCCLLWGSAFPFVKIGYSILKIDTVDTASILLFAGIRFFLAGVFAIIIGSILKKKFIYPKKENYFAVFKLSLMQTVLQYIFFYIGLSNTTGVKSSIINGASSFFAILIACFVFKQERFTKFKLIGCILGLAGIVLVNLDSSLLKLDLSFFGEGFILFSAISYAFSSAMIKQYSSKEDPVTLSGYQFAFGGLVMSIGAFIFGGRLTELTATGIVLTVYLGLLSAVAYSLWGVLLKYNPVSKITIFGFMIPVFGFFLSALILKEGYGVNIFSILALLFVCAGIFIVNKFAEKQN